MMRLIAIMLFSIGCVAQQPATDSVTDNPVIDRTIYPYYDSDTKQYATSEHDPESGLKIIFVPMSVEKAKEKLLSQKTPEDDGSKFQQGEATIAGTRVFYIKLFENKNGKNMTGLVYYKKLTEDTSAIVAGFYPTDKENYYKPVIDKALIAAKL